MEATFKSRWDDPFTGIQYLEVWIDESETEYVTFESWLYENGIRYIGTVPRKYEVTDAKINLPFRNMTAKESDAAFDFAEEQFEVEEELDNAYTEMEH